MSQDNISFDLPKNRSNVIKVIGVGGGGSNAVNYMYNQGFNGVDFVVCNTDAQALHSSPVPNKVQLGVNLTEGLGAGARPEIGGEAALESIDDLESMLKSNTKMLFLTAGMGGGTGTGAAPVIAKLAAKLGILTVGIVTMPFKFEGAIRMKQAQAGMEELAKYVDSMIVINNNKLRDVYGNLGLKSGFAKADEVLATAAKGISEVITKEYGMNIDLHDVKTVLENSGTAIMGAAMASGENRAINAIAKALDSPLLNDNSIKGAKNVLLLVVSGETEITLDEIGEINEYIQDEAGGNANIILGAGDEEEGLGDNIKITIIATGFSKSQQDTMLDKEPEKKVYVLDNNVNSATVSTEKEVKTVVTEVKEKAPVKKTIHLLEEDPEPENIIVNELVQEVVEEPVKKIVHKLVDEDFQETQPVYTKVKETPAQPIEVVENTITEKGVEEKEIMNVADEDIVITEVSKSQTTIEFDFGSIDNSVVPVEEVEDVVEKKYFDLESTTEEVVVEKEEKIVATTQVEKSETVEANTFVDGSVRYDLADFEDLETKINAAKPEDLQEEKEDVEPEMQIHIVKKDVVVKEEKKVVAQQTVASSIVDTTEIPIDKREQIGRERRERLKRFNHNFKSRTISPSSVDDLEREPAYRRAGIEISSDYHKNDASRYSIGNSGDDNVVLRKNNSYLHDNVD